MVILTEELGKDGIFFCLRLLKNGSGAVFWYFLSVYLRLSGDELK